MKLEELIGMQEIATLALQLEMSARAEDWPTIISGHVDFVKAYQEALDKLASAELTSC